MISLFNRDMNSIGCTGEEIVYKSNLLLYQAHKDNEHALYMRSTPGGITFCRVNLTHIEETKKAIGKRISNLDAIVILPKSGYLVKSFEIPPVDSREIDSILRLELEAELPVDFGTPDFSYRQVSGRQAQGFSYITHSCNKNVLQRRLDLFKPFPVRSLRVLPSLSIWRNLFYSFNNIDLFVLPISDSEYEIAFRKNAEQICLRTLRLQEETGSALAHRFIEGIRPFLKTSDEESVPQIIGWLGVEFPQIGVNGKIKILNLYERIGGTIADGMCSVNTDLLAWMTGLVLCNNKNASFQKSEYIVPQDKIRCLKQKERYVKSIWAVGVYVLACLLVWGGLRIWDRRYQTLDREISTKITSIAREGTALGDQIEQLKIIHQAQKTREDFHFILNGLYAATPVNVTYSQVQLKKTGDIILTGQSDSLSSLFLLPEQLEKQPMFENVQLTDASQTRQSGGNLAEFALTCQLVRKYIQ